MFPPLQSPSSSSSSSSKLCALPQWKEPCPSLWARIETSSSCCFLSSLSRPAGVSTPQMWGQRYRGEGSDLGSHSWMGRAQVYELFLERPVTLSTDLPGAWEPLPWFISVFVPSRPQARFQRCESSVFPPRFPPRTLGAPDDHWCPVVPFCATATS